MNTETENLEEKLRLQEAEYGVPIHWVMGPADDLRYRRLSGVLAGRMRGILEREGSGKLRLIDVGCGDGAGSYQLWSALREQGFDVEVEGYDYSERAIEWAKEKTGSLSDGTLNFAVGAAENSVYSGDDGRTVIVLLREVIEHLTAEQIDAALTSLREHFSNPYLFLTIPSVNSPVDPKHLRHYTAAMVGETMERNGFSPLEVRGFGFRPAALFKPLVWLKTKLNRRRGLWRLTGPMWSVYPPALSMTLFGIGVPSAGESPGASAPGSE